MSTMIQRLILAIALVSAATIVLLMKLAHVPKDASVLVIMKKKIAQIVTETCVTQRKDNP